MAGGVIGVATVWLPVDDMARAVAFYRDVLGCEVTQSDDSWSEVDAGGLTIGLNGRDSESPRGSGGAVISFHPEGDIEDAVRELEGRGVPFSGGVSDHPWGRVASFLDSEGNDLQFYAPPSG